MISYIADTGNTTPHDGMVSFHPPCKEWFPAGFPISASPKHWSSYAHAVLAVQHLLIHNPLHFKQNGRHKLKFIDQQRCTVGFKKECSVIFSQTSGILVIKRHVFSFRLHQMMKHCRFANLSLSADHDDRIYFRVFYNFLFEKAFDIHSTPPRNLSDLMLRKAPFCIIRFDFVNDFVNNTWHIFLERF